MAGNVVLLKHASMCAVCAAIEDIIRRAGFDGSLQTLLIPPGQVQRPRRSASQPVSLTGASRPAAALRRRGSPSEGVLGSARDRCCHAGADMLTIDTAVKARVNSGQSLPAGISWRTPQRTFERGFTEDAGAQGRRSTGSRH
jgi:acyl-CoA reductase-like NAD-dependent aldehyde dehydrogenase